MKLKKSDSHRFQTQILCWDTLVNQDSSVRVIDQLVEEFPLADLGFKNEQKKHGAPSYDPKAMIKLFIYGYMNKINSGRKLSKACQVNIEVLWLVNGIHPNYRTIQYFFSTNTASFKNLFNWFGKLLHINGIIQGNRLTIDSTKIHASNSKSKSKTIKGLSSQIKGLDKSIETYMEELKESMSCIEDLPINLKEVEQGKLDDLVDQMEATTDKKKSLKETFQKVKARTEKKKECEKLKAKMESEGLTHLGLTDQDCDKVRFSNKSYGPGYNIQMTSDAEYKMLMYVDELGPNDFKALASSSKKIEEQYDLQEPFEYLADAGYYSSKQISESSPLSQTYVLKKNEKKREGFFSIDQYIFDEEKNAYLCLDGKYLTTNGIKIEKKKEGKVVAQVYSYTNHAACQTCPLKSQCYTGKKGKDINRNIYQNQADLNNKRVKENPEIYKQRKALIEHQFGTIKHHWHFSHTNYRGREKVLAQFHLVALTYNIRRLISIWDELKEKGLLEGLIFRLFKIFGMRYSIKPLRIEIKKVAA